MEFPRQGFPLPVRENIPDPGIELASLTSSALAGVFFTTEATWEVRCAGYGSKAVNTLKVHHRHRKAIKWGDPTQRNTSEWKADVFEEMTGELTWEWKEAKTLMWVQSRLDGRKRKQQNSQGGQTLVGPGSWSSHWAGGRWTGGRGTGDRVSGCQGPVCLASWEEVSILASKYSGKS